MSADAEAVRVRIFLSSPSDVDEERSVAIAVIRRLQAWFRGRLVLVPILWEREPLLATAGFQHEIDRRAPPSAADVAVFVLWSRLGTPLSSDFMLEDGSRPTGTEWEYLRARDASRAHHVPHILVYRKTVDPPTKASLPKDLLLRQHADWTAVQAFFERHFRNAEDLSFNGSFAPFRDASEFGRILQEHLTKVLNERLAAPESGIPAATWAGSPFRGLEVFEPEHASIFFGRTRAIQDALTALRRSREGNQAFLLLLGASGSGKSSLARAGLLPLLTYPGAVEAHVTGGFCRSAILRPSDAATPLRSLVVAIRGEGALPGLAHHGSVEDLAALFGGSPEAAVSHVRGELARSGADGRLVLLVDQLEELFTLSEVSDEERTAFVAVLDALARSGVAWVVATFRSDFYGRLTSIPRLADLVEGGGTLHLPPPDAAECVEIVRLPAQVAGLVYERDARSGRTLDEVVFAEAAKAGPDALPLLEYALSSLYEKARGNVLTLEAFEAMGGIAGAVRERAETEWRALSDEGRAAFPSVLRSLVEVSGDADSVTRRPAPMREAVRTEGAREFVSRFVRARLLVADGEGDRAVVRVAHEALLRTWGRVAEQVRVESRLLRLHAWIRSRTAHWEEQHRSTGALLSGAEDLSDARRLVSGGFDLSDAERSFVDLSTGRARRGRLLRRGAVAAIAALAAAGVAMALVAERRRAEAADSRAASLRAQSRVLELATFNVGEMRDRLLGIGRPDLLRPLTSRTIAMLETESSGTLDDLRIRALAYENLSDVHRALGEVEAARDASRRALDMIDRALERWGNAPEDRRRRSTVFHRRAMLARSTGDIDEWIRLDRLALEELDALPAAHLPRRDVQEALSITHGGLATALQVRGDLPQSLAHAEAAREAAYAAHAAMGAGRSTGGHWRQDPRVAAEFWVAQALAPAGRKEDAIRALERGLALLEGPEAAFPRDAPLLDVACAFRSQLYRVYMDVGRTVDARRRLAELIRLRRTLVALFPDHAEHVQSLLVDLATECEGLRGEGRSSDALVAADALAKEVARATGRWPDSVPMRAHAAVAQLERGCALEALGRFTDARDGFRAASEGLEAVAMEVGENSDFAERLLLAHMGLARVATRMGDAPSALDWARRAMDEADARAKAAPEEYNALRNRGVARLVRFDALRTAERPAEGLPVAEEAVSQFADLATRWPGLVEGHRLHAAALQRRGDAIQARGEQRGSLPSLEEALRAIEAALALRAGDPDLVRMRYVILERIGMVREQLREFDAALAAFEAQRAALDPLLAAHPQWVELQRDRRASALNFARVRLTTGRLDEAKVEFEDALRRSETLAGTFEECLRTGGAVRRVLTEIAARKAALEGREPLTSVERMGAAYLAYGREEFAVAATWCRAALEDPALRGDLVAGHLYNAVCFAGLAAAKADATERAAWLDEGWTWAGDLVRASAERLRALRTSLGSAPEGPERNRLEWEWKEVGPGLAEALRTDPDLDLFRADPRFGALLSGIDAAAAPPR